MNVGENLLGSLILNDAVALHAPDQVRRNVRWHGSWTGLELLGHKVVLEPRKHTATVKGHRVRLGEPPRVEGNAMLVPFASLVKSLGKHVEWHKEGKYALASIR